MSKPRNKFYCDVGWRIRQARSLNKLSQAYLSERLGVTVPTVQRYETGDIQIPFEAVAKCAKALYTPVGYFLGEEGQPSITTSISKLGLSVAAEIMALPDDTIRRGVFDLVRSINRYVQDEDE